MDEWMVIRVVGAAFAVAASSGCVIYMDPKCNDLVRNGDETDVDCGGTCGQCEVGGHCEAERDCLEGTCDRGVCRPPVCANDQLDDGETDVDCGGSCRPCAGGRGCQVATDCFSGNCVVETHTCFALSQVTFADAVSYPSGVKPYVLMSSDLDGDGDLDLAAANELDSTISLFRNTDASTGMFERMASPSGDAFPTGEYPTGGRIADLDGDGVLDVVTADYHGNSVSVLSGRLSEGSYTLAEKASYPTLGGAETSNLAVGDLNGDAVIDVVACNPQRSSVSVFLGRGDGTLAPGVAVPIGIDGASEPYSVALGDFDGDGHADAAVADNRGSNVHLLHGNGDGTFAPDATLLPLAGLGSFIIIATDIDADGVTDLVCANRSSDDVTVLLGRPDGGFRKALVSSTGEGTGPYAVAVADFNLDGVPDLVTPDYHLSNVSVLIGNGDGTFEAPLLAGPTGDTTYGIVAGDFNGDGRPDVATANALSNDLSIKFSTAR